MKYLVVLEVEASNIERAQDIARRSTITCGAVCSKERARLSKLASNMSVRMSVRKAEYALEQTAKLQALRQFEKMTGVSL